MCSVCDELLDQILENAVMYRNVLRSMSADELNQRYADMSGETDLDAVAVRQDIMNELHGRADMENEQR